MVERSKTRKLDVINKFFSIFGVIAMVRKRLIDLILLLFLSSHP